MEEPALKLKYIALLLCLFPLLLAGQPKWKRSAPPVKADLELFHATMTANFPTAETLKKGDFEYEISHRFRPSINDGFDAMYGFDGPARIRMALAYGLSNRLMLKLGRSNILDNIDLQAKVQLLQFRGKTLPSLIALQGGVAWNTEIPVGADGAGIRSRTDGRNFQYYAQLVYNTMLLNKKLGVGIVPSYLYNSAIFTVDSEYTFTLGNYYYYYVNSMWSLWVEYNPIVTGYQGVIGAGETGKSHNSLAIGFDIETGGHFFHIFVTNNDRLNPAQYLVGADRGAGEWRFGFGITRHL